MIEPVTSAAFQPYRIKTLASRVGALNAPAMSEELLPFTVRLVRNEGDLSKAVSIRHSAYARHLPEFAETLKSPETADAENGVVVLLAESKLDGSPLGSMRIQTNQYKPLCLEQSVTLPAWLKSIPLSAGTLRMASGAAPLGFIQTWSPVFISMAVMRPHGGLTSGAPRGRAGRPPVRPPM